MAAQLTSLASAGTATAIICDPVKKATTVQATVTSGGSAASLFIQFTLDDPTSVTGSSVVWANLSSALTSSGLDTAGGIIYSVLSPIGGLRLSSTTFTSGTVTLKSLQSVTG